MLGLTQTNILNIRRGLLRQDGQSRILHLDTMSLPHLYVLTSFMLSVSALFVIVISSLIIHGHQEVLHTAQQIKSRLAVESVDSAVTDSFHDYYSVFNSRGGWLNLAHLLLGVGLVTLLVSVLGLLGLHARTCFLLLTFTLLQLVLALLQAGAVLVLRWRRRELLQLYHSSHYRGAASPGQLQHTQQILLVLSLMWAAVTLLVTILTLALRCRGKTIDAAEPQIHAVIV